MTNRQRALREAKLLAGAADTIAGYLSDHEHVMKREDVAEERAQIKACRRAARKVVIPPARRR